MASRNHINVAKRVAGPMRCLGCKRHIVVGDRCADCQQRLRDRKRRKPR
jgi:hypothetical protein